LPEVIKLKEGCPTTCIEDPAEALAAMNIWWFLPRIKTL
jgi:hypothetical protein